MDDLETLPIARPPDSQVMRYAKLRWHFEDWPVWLIDELAYALAEQDEKNDY